MRITCPFCKKSFYKKQRTNSQNAYYWAVVVSVAGEHFGYDPDEMHEAFKFMFLKRDETGKPLTVRSTTALGVAEFSDYVERCIRWCAEQGIVIPESTGVESYPDPSEIDL